MTPQDTPVGPVLGEEEREKLWTNLRSTIDPYVGQMEVDADDATDALLPLVAFLLSSAREEGREEGRGDMERLEREWRADERERVARMLDGKAASMADAESIAGYARHRTYADAAAVVRSDQ